mmetsp:Transcript_40148/g.65091  ORF Transcript_40148/g.65091 Transcript_40148/m.65091 type:complete len:309 (+) Transcript_40148:230-1156(+)
MQCTQKMSNPLQEDEVLEDAEQVAGSDESDTDQDVHAKLDLDLGTNEEEYDACLVYCKFQAHSIPTLPNITAYRAAEAKTENELADKYSVSLVHIFNPNSLDGSAPPSVELTFDTPQAATAFITAAGPTKSLKVGDLVISNITACDPSRPRYSADKDSAEVFIHGVSKAASEEVITAAIEPYISVLKITRLRSHKNKKLNTHTVVVRGKRKRNQRNQRIHLPSTLEGNLKWNKGRKRPFKWTIQQRQRTVSNPPHPPPQPSIPPSQASSSALHPPRDPPQQSSTSQKPNSASKRLQLLKDGQPYTPST